MRLCPRCGEQQQEVKVYCFLLSLSHVFFCSIGVLGKSPRSCCSRDGNQFHCAAPSCCRRETMRGRRGGEGSVSMSCLTACIRYAGKKRRDRGGKEGHGVPRSCSPAHPLLHFRVKHEHLALSRVTKLPISGKQCSTLILDYRSLRHQNIYLHDPFFIYMYNRNDDCLVVTFE